MLLFFILIVLSMGLNYCIPLLHIQQIFAILTENGTCTDGLHKVPARILNNNGINGSFNRLISDNRELAEIICQNLLNGNATIDMAPSNYSKVVGNESYR